MTADAMWAVFAKMRGLNDAHYEAWAFGGAPDRLASLVMQGIKTATSTACAMFDCGVEPEPHAGDYSVILDSRGEAVCILQTTHLTRCRFDEVTPEHAFREGEDDRSLDSWREVHEAYFTECLRGLGLPFSPAIPVLCEEFIRVFPE